MSEVAVTEPVVTAVVSAQHKQPNQSDVSTDGVITGMFFQAKLTVGAQDDSLEREADAMAEQVMRMPENSFIQRKCVHCVEDEKVQLKPLAQSITPFFQTKTAASPSQVGGSVSQSIQSSRGSGSAMDNRTKSFMSERFGSDFGGVNIHTGSKALQLSRQLNAKAFTVGNDIYFNQGQYQPETNEGKFLLAHELTHTIQQSGVDKNIQRTVDSVEINCGDSQIYFAHDGTSTNYHLNNCQVTDGEYTASVTLAPDSVHFELNEANRETTDFQFRYDIGPGQENPNSFFRGQSSVRFICTHIPRASNTGSMSIPVIYEMLSTLPIAAGPSSHLLAMGDMSWLTSGGSMRWSTYMRPNFWTAMMPSSGMRYADRVVTLSPEIDLMSRMGPRIENEMLAGGRFAWENRTWTTPDGTVRNFSPAELESIPSLIRRINAAGVSSLSDIELAMLRNAAELHIGGSSPGSPFASYSVPGETASFLTGNIPEGNTRYRVRMLVDSSSLDVSGPNAFNEGVYNLTNIEEAEIMITANSDRRIVSVERVPANTAAPESTLLVRGGSAIRWGGRILLVYGAYHTVDRIATSTPEERPTVVAEETGSWGGGILGAELGGAACIALGIATEGVGLLACGLVGGIGLGTIGSEVGHTDVAGEAPEGGVIDTVTRVPERASEFAGWLDRNIRQLYLSGY